MEFMQFIQQANIPREVLMERLSGISVPVVDAMVLSVLLDVREALATQNAKLEDIYHAIDDADDIGKAVAKHLKNELRGVEVGRDSGYDGDGGGGNPVDAFGQCAHAYLCDDCRNEIEVAHADNCTSSSARCAYCDRAWHAPVVATPQACTHTYTYCSECQLSLGNHLKSCTRSKPTICERCSETVSEPSV